MKTLKKPLNNKPNKEEIEQAFKQIEQSDVKVSKTAIFGNDPNKTLKELQNWKNKVNKP